MNERNINLEYATHHSALNIWRGIFIIAFIPFITTYILLLTNSPDSYFSLITLCLIGFLLSAEVLANISIKKHKSYSIVFIISQFFYHTMFFFWEAIYNTFFKIMGTEPSAHNISDNLYLILLASLSISFVLISLIHLMLVRFRALYPVLLFIAEILFVILMLTTVNYG